MTSYIEYKNTSALEGENAGYLEALYEQYQSDPLSLSKEWQDYFAKTFQAPQQEPNHTKMRQQFLQLSRANVAASAVCGVDIEKQVNVIKWIDAFRQFGHLSAKTDPLNLEPKRILPELTPEYYGLSLSDTFSYDTHGLDGLATATVQNIKACCESIYCGSIGFEYEQVNTPNEVEWLRKKIEAFPHWQISKVQKIDLLKQLTATEGLEKALGAKYVGVTRFSVEGGDSQIPLLNFMLSESAAGGTKEVVIGMAHRGRLNVLINVLGMPTQDIIAQFEGTYPYAEDRSDDVKYHYGYSADLATKGGVLHATLGFNPSHLEIISPVVQGSVRARQDRRKDLQHNQVLALQIHGDSAFIGQGVVMETFELSQTRGFKIGGSVHLVINNQVGFTTSNKEDTRSSYYCTDAAKIVDAPIFHVNGDDPEAVLFVGKLALEYHFQFHKDVVIDLVCYRRFGHNEGDEPSATQPLMYKTIRQLPTVRKLYADRLLQEKVLTQSEIDAMVSDYRKALDEQQELIAQVENPDYQKYAPDWKKYIGTSWQTPAETKLSQQVFASIAPKLTQVPEGFKMQAQVAKIINARASAYQGEAPLIWGDAEILAYASLVAEGYPVRLVGQDAGRGTFAHRHSVLYDQNTGTNHITLLNHLSETQASFTVVDSILSENAVMAFEYGYASSEPKALVLWEAQYGDFANGAQVVVDQFLSSAEQKWGRYSGLVLLLPHGYEAAGPEHSSSRLERYLQLCAQNNMQVCIPTTPAQMFHVLRRQVLRPYRKPLIILTPKGLLRKMTSNLSDVFNGEFQCVIPEVEAKIKNAKRVVICSGRVYYDVLERREALKNTDVAIVRLEQLYPFPKEILTKMLAQYSKVKDFVWCQEEPENQGAWRQLRHNFEACLTQNQTIRYVGRAEAASTAAGYKKLHLKEQSALLDAVFS